MTEDNFKSQQVVEIAQAFAKETLAQNPNAQMNINIFGQVNFVQKSEEKPPQQVENQGVLKLPPINPVALTGEFDEQLIEDVKALMDRLPEPRFDYLIRLVFEVAHKYYVTHLAVRDWLGITLNQTKYWYGKLNLFRKDKEE